LAHDKNANAFQPPSDDPAVPKTSEETRPFVKQLKGAIMNNAEIRESVRSKCFERRWKDNADFYHPADIEKLAWHIVVSYKHIRSYIVVDTDCALRAH
jgi:hypothetical protein